MAKREILVISSDPHLLRFLNKLNGGEEYEVVSSRQTEIDAIRDTFIRERSNLIVLDIMMPSLDGIKTCLEIRRFSTIPIMMLTAWGAGEDRVKGINMASDNYLTESFGIDELKTRLEDIFRRNLAAG